MSRDAVFVDLGGKDDGVLSIDEVRDSDGQVTVQIGDEIQARVVEIEGKSGGVVLRLGRSDDPAVALATEAARVCKVPLTVSFADQESDEELAARLPTLNAEIFRTVKVPGDTLLQAAYDAGINWINAPILLCGRYELPRWLREQSVSKTEHRYGLIASLAK